MTKADEKLSPNTVFVQNLPYSCTNEVLEETFSKYGAIKRCFVIKNKDSSQCRGIGYVTFVQRDDLKKVLEAPLTLEGRRLSVRLSNRKEGKKQKKKKKTDDSDAEEDCDEIEEDNKVEKTDVDKQKKSTATTYTNITSLSFSRGASERVVVIGNLGEGLSATISIDEIKKLIGPESRVRQLRYPITEGGDISAVVLYRGKRDAILALKKFNGKNFNGRELTARLFTQKVRKPVKPETISKKSRLIVRNLDFKCTETELREAFAHFGNITEVTIPKRANGRRFGFGMVQFSQPSEALLALEAVNAKQILGRTVAVDWAMPKSKYLQANQEPDTAELSDAEAEESGSESKKRKANEKHLDSAVKRKRAEDESDESVENMETDESINSDYSDETDNDDEEEEELEEDDDDDDEEELEDDDDEDEEDDLEEDSDDDDSQSEKKKKLNDKKPGNRNKSLQNDVSQGRTVFIRNLSFDTMDEDLEELMEQYGDVRYCRIVVDKNTGHSRGTAFVQFKTKEQADACLAASDSSANSSGGVASNVGGDSGGLSLDGRRLSVSLALPKAKVEEIKEERKGEKNKHGDKRNLHLLREGLVRAGTQAAEGLSKTDLQKRAKVEMMARQKLKNPNIFVSPTRLCVRNLPTSVDDQALRRAFLKACGNPRAKITESRIMRDLERKVGAQKQGKSMGFGFVNFVSHEDALAALRATNNNPELYGKDKRLIVEFSLENRAALMAKERRIERAKQKRDSLATNSTATNGSTKAGSQKRQLARPGKSLKSQIIPTVAPASGTNGTKIKPGMPSHRGPKIRHKKRPGTSVPAAKKTVKADQRKSSESVKEKKNKKRKGEKREARDDVDRLIDKYRQRITNAASQSQNINKWR